MIDWTEERSPPTDLKLDSFRQIQNLMDILREGDLSGEGFSEKIFTPDSFLTVRTVVRLCTRYAVRLDAFEEFEILPFFDVMPLTQVGTKHRTKSVVERPLTLEPYLRDLCEPPPRKIFERGRQQVSSPLLLRKNLWGALELLSAKHPWNLTFSF